MEQAQAALKRAEQAHAAAQAAVDALQAQQTAAAQAVPAQPLEELQARQTRLTAARNTLREQAQQLAAQLLPNCAAAEKYRAAAAARTQLEQRWQWVSALAATAGGTLASKQKIRLEAYIQMNYLDRILRHANTRLMQMTAGQYELERIGAENQRSQSGLDLGVIDHYNGTRRNVKTLSGGESFKASLALALGLSDEVQSAAGGIRLDTLFLDEGFGSLDEESLEQAMRVLAGLTEGERLVSCIYSGRTAGSFSEDRPLGWDPVARRAIGRAMEWLATTATAASGGSREPLLGPRPARRKHKRSRCWVPQPVFVSEEKATGSPP